MRLLHSALRRLRSFLGKDSKNDELSEELRFHLELQIEENIALGMSPEQARAAARDSFGSVAPATEESYESRGVALIDDFVQDIRYGCDNFASRPDSLRRHPLAGAGHRSQHCDFHVTQCHHAPPTAGAESKRTTSVRGRQRAGQHRIGSRPKLATVLLILLSRLSPERCLFFRNGRGRQHAVCNQSVNCRRGLPNDPCQSCLRQLLFRSRRSSISRPNN